MLKNTYSSTLDAFHKIGVNISRDAFYKCVEQEIKNQTPVEVISYEMMTNLSSITEDDYNVMNHFFYEKSTTETSRNLP